MTKKTLDADAIMNELKGQSVFFAGQQSPTLSSPEKSVTKQQEKKSKKIKSRTSELPKSQTSRVTKSGTPGLPELQTYELRNFDALRRLDVRLTSMQKRFLDDLEENIRQKMPEGERSNPESKRITKNAIIRVFVEIFRQLSLPVDARRFQNEHDLLQALYKGMLKKIPDLQTSEVSK